MPNAKVAQAVAFEDSTCSLMARIRAGNGEYLQQAGMASLELAVFDESDLSEVYTDTLVIIGVIFDTLQTDARWSTDGVGYNFRFDVPPAVLAEGSKNYRFEFTFNFTTAYSFKTVFRVNTISVVGS